MILDSRSSMTLKGDGKSAASTFPSTRLDLRGFPQIFVLPVHLALDELHGLVQQLNDVGATVTDNLDDAKIMLGALSSAKRARFELQCRKLRTEPILDGEVALVDNRRHKIDDIFAGDGPSTKKRKLSVNNVRSEAASTEVDVIITESETGDEDEDEDEMDDPSKPMSQLSMFPAMVETSPSPPSSIGSEDILASTLDSVKDRIKVIKLDWLHDSVKFGVVQPLEQYLVYEGRPVRAVTALKSSDHMFHGPQSQITTNPYGLHKQSSLVNLSEAAHAPQSDLSPAPPRHDRRERDEAVAHKQFEGRKFASSTPKNRQHARSERVRPTRLLRETTSEHDEVERSILPEMPQWVQDNKIYSCERSTPLHSPNDDFIELLLKIKLARRLTGDEIGVRAYSTSIASLAAYPHALSSTREILALPGCDDKIARLFQEWKQTGRIEAVDEIDSDEVLKSVMTFYNIWGVGHTTAQQFYYDEEKKWRDLDDVLEYGWDTLTRVQQIGVKYYDEFQMKIPRSEVEYIASVVAYHAKQIVDDGIECVIVGGYRRGKLESGDVDLIISHREEAATKHLIQPLVNALEKSGWITHILTIHETNSARDQQTLPLKGNGVRGSGFDTLDKALVVWQDLVWPTRTEDLAENPDAKNPMPHRRVDIIVSPWRTVGCAVAGWSAGTTFQRDLRRYAKHVKGWKFDSSGVRDRVTGKWQDLEKWSHVKTRARTWQEAERRVFEGMGLEFREPWERCTG